MKKLSMTLAFVMIAGSFAVNAQEKKKSPAKTVEGKIGDTEITINYHAPSVRDRQVFGELEKFGKLEQMMLQLLSLVQMLRLTE